MSLANTTTQVSFLLRNPRAYKKFLVKPELEGLALGLDKDEIGYILSIQPQQIASERAIVQGRRFHGIFDFLPWTESYLGTEQALSYVKEYIAVNPKESLTNESDIAHFQIFIHKKTTDPLLLELIQYEAAICKLVFMREAQIDTANSTGNIKSGERIRLGKHTALIRSKINIEARAIGEKVKLQETKSYFIILQGIYRSDFIESIFTNPNAEIPEITVFQVDEIYEAFIRRLIKEDITMTEALCKTFAPLITSKALCLETKPTLVI